MLPAAPGSEQVTAAVCAQVALSREGARQRVQHLLRADAAEVVGLLLDQGGFLYVCGDARMADDTSAALTEMIARERGMSRLAARDAVAALRDGGRLQLDVWGVTSFFAQGARSFADRRADSARAWLRLMSQEYV